jgi:glycosyltransferase involved in cell wall biosynthesis
MAVSATPRLDGAAAAASRADALRPRRLAVVTARSSTEADGIRDYTMRLLQELEARELWDVSLSLRLIGGGWVGDSQGPPGWTMPRSVRESDAILLQYNPFSYGRRGFAPRLIVEVARARLRRRRPLVALMVHETYVDMKNWRWTLMGGWQRLQLYALRVLTDIQFCATEAWVARLGRRRRPGSVHHLPVGSNFPDRRENRDAERERLGVGAETVVLGCFGLRHPGRLEAHVERSADAVARTGRDVVVLNLGAGPAYDETRETVRTHAPGFLEDEEVARVLSTVDVFLAPYADGVSTRRTTVMAALQHGLPVVGTDGPLTDSVLRDAGHALRLVPVDRPGDFADTVASLAASDETRRELGQRGRELYESQFDWPVIADRLLQTLAAARARA